MVKPRSDLLDSSMGVYIQVRSQTYCFLCQIPTPCRTFQYSRRPQRQGTRAQPQDENGVPRCNCKQWGHTNHDCPVKQQVQPVHMNNVNLPVDPPQFPPLRYVMVTLHGKPVRAVLDSGAQSPKQDNSSHSTLAHPTTANHFCYKQMLQIAELEQCYHRPQIKRSPHCLLLHEVFKQRTALQSHGTRRTSNC